jgi:hypothetical protein
MVAHRLPPCVFPGSSPFFLPTGSESGALNSLAIVFVSIVLEAIPFMLFGSLVGGFIEAFVSRERMATFLPKKGWLTVCIAAGAGIVFPVCECAVVPVVRRLIGKGLPVLRSHRLSSRRSHRESHRGCLNGPGLCVRLAYCHFCAWVWVWHRCGAIGMTHGLAVCRHRCHQRRHAAIEDTAPSSCGCHAISWSTIIASSVPVKRNLSSNDKPCKRTMRVDAVTAMRLRTVGSTRQGRPLPTRWMIFWLWGTILSSALSSPRWHRPISTVRAF